MDCFYAAVHMRDEPRLRGRPVVIGGPANGRGVVAAASYEARRFGVRSAMPSAQAARLCPDAVFLAPEFDRYRAESRRVFEVFAEFTSLVQPVSIDEAYLDLTGELDRWGSATAAAREIRRRVSERLGLTVSIGVAPNRLVAKIASDHDKPDGLTVVRPEQIEAFLAPLPVRALLGVGPATEQRLRERFGCTTVAELRRIDRAELELALGRFGGVLYRYARGLDDRPVVVERVRKSLSAERTFGSDIEDPGEIASELRRLTKRVAAALQERDLRGSGVHLKVRYSDFTTVTRSCTLDEPGHDEEQLLAAVMSLLRRIETEGRRIRLLGVGTSRFEGQETDGPTQLLLPQLEPESSPRRSESN
ncbi:MAG: DNA polymerase IV [Acidobacteria bacterium]|nr:MAG: DNA polymerase IV [Acidobacteriota bacterium]REK11662.1 MAG: DNA polymerase IV [Acidobacteriota bacterium]